MFEPASTVQLFLSPFLLPVSEMALAPFMSGECITLPTHVGLDVSSELVRHTATGSLHGTEWVQSNRKERF